MRRMMAQGDGSFNASRRWGHQRYRQTEHSIAWVFHTRDVDNRECPVGRASRLGSETRPTPDAGGRCAEFPLMWIGEQDCVTTHKLERAPAAKYFFAGSAVG